ncbi:4-carboxymuconolactone decarboxylase domain/alkylhydroperoxidase AhpD family core domain protein [Vulgatibacter incomptus]|uniref:4-carboxymuconolactone decarboxylase domain/alkylhydroperoxidase AhpD family core domain protein n=2 Tax=Vulgatibacter incomptus TaxID=1391653 RepID=A0A0K1PHA6_9BACT|nr:4-carboxymuconolactone decarboxylase domain/alkylhydroperoxidase AhpD family core domain protein [Vulgatibacter incomptus]
MAQRIDMVKTAREPLRDLLAVERYLNKSGLEKKLLDLVKLRASQINGCAYCIDMHSKDLRAEGETEQRLYELQAWREAPFYSKREQAALAWTEAVTEVGSTGVPDDVYERARSELSEQELTDLTLAIAMINAWNRLSIAFRQEVGTYQPPKAKREKREEAAPYTSTSEEQEIMH